jgi:methylation protein EvaC
MTACLVCESLSEPFMSFGRMPIADGFLCPDQSMARHFEEFADLPRVEVRA